MRRTNDTTRTTYTGRARALAGGWFGPRPWPVGADSRAQLATAIGLRLASGETLQTIGSARHAQAGGAVYPTRAVRAAITDAERDVAADLAAGYAMLRGALRTGSGTTFHGGTSEHGYGVTLAALPPAASEAHIGAAFAFDRFNLTPRTDLRAWQVQTVERAREALALQWITEAREETRAPLDRARRMRAAALADPSATRAACEAGPIGADAIGADLSAYGASCADADDERGERAYATFAADRDRDADEAARANTPDDSQRFYEAQQTLRESAEAEAEQGDREAERTQQHTEAEAPAPMNPRGSSDARKRGTSEANAAAAIEAAAAAALRPDASAAAPQPATGAPRPTPGGGWTLAIDGKTCRATITTRTRKGGRR